MSATDTKKASKQELFTFLKCGIPVIALAVMIAFAVFMPEESGQFAGLLFGYLWSGVSFAVHWFALAFRTISTIIYVVTVVAGLGFLWVCCALTHLKKKGLTGHFYMRVTKAFNFFGGSVMCLAIVTLLCWSARPFNPAQALQSLVIFMVFMASVFVLFFVGMMTIKSNEATWAEIKKQSKIDDSESHAA
jgi:hypothetical protein